MYRSRYLISTRLKSFHLIYLLSLSTGLPVSFSLLISLSHSAATGSKQIASNEEGRCGFRVGGPAEDRQPGLEGVLHEAEHQVHPPGSCWASCGTRTDPGTVGSHLTQVQHRRLPTH
jgi:hypothetical protein